MPKHDYPTGPIVWRTGNDSPADNERHGLAAAIKCDDPSLTVQSFTEDANINVLARRFGITDIPFAPVSQEVIDLTNPPDLRDILEARRAAADHFSSLPMKLRKRFRNSPEELWDFLHDPENRDEAVRLGLLKETSSSAGAAATPENSSTPSHTGQAPTGGTAVPPENPPKDAPASK